MEIKKIYPHTVTTNRLKNIALALLVIAIGLFCVNQTLKFYYSSQLLRGPCNLCAELNPNQTNCIYNCFNAAHQVYSDSLGNMRDASGVCYDLNGNEITCIDLELP